MILFHIQNEIFNSQKWVFTFTEKEISLSSPEVSLILTRGPKLTPAGWHKDESETLTCLNQQSWKKNSKFLLPFCKSCLKQSESTRRYITVSWV